jgi:radical SAM superfamily enzyme with C-terminal helix-hairpin-helix motif
MTPRRAGLAGPVIAVVLTACSCGLFRHSSTSPAPVDLNAASARQIERLPGITPSMAARIISQRPYGDADELVERGILTERELARLAERVVVKRRAR